LQNLVDYLWQLVAAVYLNDLRLEHKLGMLVAFPIFFTGLTYCSWSSINF